MTVTKVYTDALAVAVNGTYEEVSDKIEGAMKTLDPVIEFSTETPAGTVRTTIVVNKIVVWTEANE